MPEPCSRPTGLESSEWHFKKHHGSFRARGTSKIISVIFIFLYLKTLTYTHPHSPPPHLQTCLFSPTLTSHGTVFAQEMVSTGWGESHLIFVSLTLDAQLITRSLFAGALIFIFGGHLRSPSEYMSQFHWFLLLILTLGAGRVGWRRALTLSPTDLHCVWPSALSLTDCRNAKT